jgi:hypothetical protein
MSRKTASLLGLCAAAAIFFAVLLLYPAVSTLLALGLAPFSAYWDSYMFALVVPMVAIAKGFWNPSADRAVSPLTRRFLGTGLFVAFGLLIVVLVSLLNYYVIVPDLYGAFVATAYSAGAGPGVDVLVQLGLIIAAPVICFSIASPPGLSRSVRSLRNLMD